MEATKRQSGGATRGGWCRSLLVGAVVIAMGSGCARTVVSEPLDLASAGRGLPEDMAFWEVVPSRGAITNDEGLRGLFLMGGGRDPGSYERRVQEAKERGWLRESWDEAGDLAMQRGTLARAGVVIGEIRGGVMLQLLGPTGRYANREMVYRRVMSGGTELQTISGGEFVTFIGRLEDDMARRGLKAGR